MLTSSLSATSEKEEESNDDDSDNDDDKDDQEEGSERDFGLFLLRLTLLTSFPRFSLHAVANWQMSLNVHGTDSFVETKVFACVNFASNSRESERAKTDWNSDRSQ